MIIFNIKNTQEDYAKCLSIIDYINDESKHFKFDSPVNMCVYYDNKNYSNDFKSVKKSVIYEIEKNIDKLSSKNILTYQDVDISLKTKKLYNGYYFRVVNDDEADCVNLSFYELLADNLDNCYLGIIPIDNGDIYRISSFYSVLNYKHTIDFYNKRFFINQVREKDGNNRIIQRFNLRGINTARTYFPLLKANLETYKALNRSTKHFFVKNDNLKKGPRNYTEKCVEEFCVKLYNELSQSLKETIAELKEKIENTSYLALAYLLSFLYYTDKDKISKSNLISIFVDAEDFAEGTLQLIENAYIHASNGYFCYRIHKKETKGKYFYEYYHGQPNANHDKCSEYLEILISDYNIENDIPSKFRANLYNNPNISQELKSRFDDIELKDFFDYYGNKHNAWNDYYRIPENIALHYGLLSFEQIVNRTNGYLSLVSTAEHFSNEKNVYFKSQDSISKKINCNNRAHIPGTQYRILFPIKYVDKNMPTGLNANLLLRNNAISKIKIINIKAIDILNKVINTLQKNNNNQKNEYIKLYVEEMLYDIENKYQIIPHTNYEHIVLCIDCEKIFQSNEAEVLTKSILWMLNKEDFKINKIGLINTSHTLFSVFIRVFGILYYKVEHCQNMQNKEVFLCDKDCQTEIEFLGEDISNAISVSHFLSNSKGEYPIELTILEQIATKCEINTHKNYERLEVFPFDVVLPKENNTLFERKVYLDLNRNIQEYPFGCKLNNVHMQVGSKIHITDAFFEATLLFEISNYVTRFAYILAKKIYNKLIKQSKINNTVLVGYETYSEMLIVHTVRVL